MWYVYKITFSTGQFYIGYRRTKKPVEQDFLVRYYSSSKVVKELISQGVLYTGEVLAQFAEQSAAYEHEQKMIHDHFNLPLILNRVCYYKRKGFGVLSEAAKAKISDSSKKKWANPEYKKRMSETHKARWTDELRGRQSKRLRNEHWTEERRSAHAKTLSGRKGHQKCKGVAKPDGFGKKVSKALSGRKKSMSHRKALSEARKNKTYPRTKIEYNGNTYFGWKEFERETGISKYVCRRLNLAQQVRIFD